LDKPKRYTVTPPPYIRSAERVSGMMLDVLIALTPALIVAVIIFGLRVLMLTAVSVASSVGCEWLWTKMRRRKSTVGDLSAVVTGVLLSFMLPASVPLWLPAVGAAFAVIVVKELFGGLGKNLFNPAVGGYVFLLLSWPDYMTRFANPQLLRRLPLPVFATPKVGYVRDALSSVPDISGRFVDATHLGDGSLLAVMQSGRKVTWDLWDLLTGMREGALGETAVLALLAGCAYLIWRRALKFRVTAGFILSVAVLSLIFPMGGYHYADTYPATALFGGMLLLGAIFLATDPVTSPVTPGGQWVYGIGCGVLTELIRHRGAFPDGVAFAILLMNVLTWTLDRYLRPKEHPKLDALREKLGKKLREMWQRVMPVLGKAWNAVRAKCSQWIAAAKQKLAEKAAPKAETPENTTESADKPEETAEKTAEESKKSDAVAADASAADENPAEGEEAAEEPEAEVKTGDEPETEAAEPKAEPGDETPDERED